MKQIKIGLTLFTCIVLLFQCNFVKAIHVLPQEAVAFYGTKIYKDIYYQDKVLEIPIVMGMYNGEHFPVYALSKEKHALDESTAFYTHANNIIQNDEIRKILLYGYPNCNNTRLNCSNEEAYLVTQIAIWNEYYHYDLSKFTFTKENKYPNIITNVQAFLEELDGVCVSKKNPYLAIEEKTFEWQDENENEFSKTYQVLSDMEFEKYELKVESNEAQYIKIVNEENEPQKSFAKGEKFKILVPNSLDINFKITATANFETMPVKSGNGYEDYWESYLFLEETETIETSLRQSSIQKPVKPAEPTEPTDPEIPSNPGEEPTNPEIPSNPGEEPTNPEEPDNTGERPTIPEEPNNSGKEPTNPEEPDNTGEEPTIPEEPNNTSKQPTTPEKPNNPSKEPASPEESNKNEDNNNNTQSKENDKTETNQKDKEMNITSSKQKNTKKEKGANSIKNEQNKKLPRTGC